MTRRDTSDWDRAWREFVSEDARVRPPDDLARRTIDAVRHRAPPRPPRRPRRFVPVGAVAVVAVLVLAVAIYVGLSTIMRPARDRATVIGDPAVGIERRPLPPALLTLAADPVRDTEAMQLVRVRVPRTTLMSAGLLVGGTHVDEIVDVDVLVGEDGLPREIRGVHRVLD